MLSIRSELSIVDVQQCSFAGDNSKENVADPAHRRKGDMEFENQLAMALQVRSSLRAHVCTCVHMPLAYAD